MKGFFSRIHFREVDLNVYKKGTISTLLVPRELIEEIEENFPKVSTKRGMRVNLRAGLRMLLDRHRGFFAMGCLPFTQKPKLTYQEEGLDLKEFKFRPNDADWAELGIIAYGLGVSRCWLFSFMLELERNGFRDIFSIPGIKNAVATPSVSRPQQILRIRGRKRFLKRILHFRV